MTKVAIIVLCEDTLSVWGNPPLSPHPPKSFNDTPANIPSLFTVTLPDELVHKDDLFEWGTISYWYSASSQPLYINVLRQDADIHAFDLHTFEIVIKPNLSDVFLRVVNTSQAHDFDLLPEYRICDDTLVYCWHSDRPDRFRVDIPSLSSHPVLIPTSETSHISMDPASGRLVQLEADKIIVLDFL